MGSTCCSGDDDHEGKTANTAGRQYSRPPRTYDSDDSSDPGGVNPGYDDDDIPKSKNDSSDENEGTPGFGAVGGGTTSGAEDDKLSVNQPLLGGRPSTIHAINRNVMEGWKNAVASGNDSLVIHLYEEYKEYDVINQKFENGDNSLLVACQTKKLNVAYFLLTKGISVNALNEKNGNCALHYACEQRDEKMVKLLLKNGCDPNVVNKKGKLPIDIAKRYRSVAIQKLLKDASEKNAVDSVFGDEFDPDELDKQQSKTKQIHRVTELKGKKIGTYVGGLLHQSDDEDMNDSDGSQSGGPDFKRTGTELTDDSDEDYKPKTKEEEANQKTQLELHRIKQANPFAANRLQRKVTKKIIETNDSEPTRSTSIAENKILAKRKAKLPELEGWLEKRKPRPPYQWQKRWVVVKDTHILWSDKQRSIDNPSDQSQRKEFNGFLNINVLQEASKYDTKSQNKFIIKARDAKRGQTREYMWKCPSTEDRNYWVKGLRQYMKYHEDAYKYGV